MEKSSYLAYGAKESDYRPDRWQGFREDYGFTGKEEDVEVGLVYFGKRFLSPQLGRWVSADPLAVHAPGEADLNLYAYVSGAVLKSVDPVGLHDDDAVVQVKADLAESEKQRTALDSEIGDLRTQRDEAQSAGDSGLVGELDVTLKEREGTLVALQEKIDASRAFMVEHPSPIDIGPRSGGGLMSYYQGRAKDFVERNPGATPPNYYLEYGDKYVKKFSLELRPKLSSEGKGWVDATRWELQEGLEQLRKAEPHAFAALERSGSGLEDAAFDSHPDAYMRGGLSHLEFGDMWKIAQTPGADLLRWGSVKQVLTTATKLAPVWTDQVESSGAQLLSPAMYTYPTDAEF